MALDESLTAVGVCSIPQNLRCSAMWLVGPVAVVAVFLASPSFARVDAEATSLLPTIADGELEVAASEAASGMVATADEVLFDYSEDDEELDVADEGEQTALADDPPARIVGDRAPSPAVQVSGIATTGDMVSGTVVNQSSNTVSEVTLFIRQAFLWNDERHPGNNDLGRAMTYKLAEPIPPHANRQFSLQTGPLPQRSDGHFVTTVEVASFTEVGG